MLGSVGMPELVVILIIAMLIFGPQKLPELGRSLGKSISEFKRATRSGGQRRRATVSDGASAADE